VAQREIPYGLTTATVKYQHTDALGTPIAVTDASKAVIQTSEYEPYGQLVNRALTDGPGFTGHVQDATTGLTYMQQRYYDPMIGRFLSVDPVAANPNTGASFNRYMYGSNNPYRFLDPDGRTDRAWYDISGRVNDWNIETAQLHMIRAFNGPSEAIDNALVENYTEAGMIILAIQSAALPEAGPIALEGIGAKAGLYMREASLLKKTTEGATRIGASSLRGGAMGRMEIAFTRSFGKEFPQNNGARAFVTKTSEGKFNVAFFGKNGYITSMKNMSEKSLLKQAAKFEWRLK
jgi:RHS repeat-associated protein